MKERELRNFRNVWIVEAVVWTVLCTFFSTKSEHPYISMIAVAIIVTAISGWCTYYISDDFYKRKDKKKQKQKESKKFVKDNIPIGKWIQVVPKEKVDDFLFEIIDIADIYAYREDEGSAVEIYLDFHFEEKKRFYERVKKRYFTEFYKIHKFPKTPFIFQKILYNIKRKFYEYT